MQPNDCVSVAFAQNLNGFAVQRHVLLEARTTQHRDLECFPILLHYERVIEAVAACKLLAKLTLFEVDLLRRSHTVMTLHPCLVVAHRNVKYD